MSEFGVDRGDLKDIYSVLLLNGLGQWVEGHFAAASTIAYQEPLNFYLYSNRRGLAPLDIYSTLLAYWSGEIPVGGLNRLMGQW